jgi:hypothetical protein
LNLNPSLFRILDTDVLVWMFFDRQSMISFLDLSGGGVSESDEITASERRARIVIWENECMRVFAFGRDTPGNTKNGIIVILSASTYNIHQQQQQ